MPLVLTLFGKQLTLDREKLVMETKPFLGPGQLVEAPAFIPGCSHGPEITVSR